MELLSVNVARPKRVEYTDAAGGVTGIDKRPVTGPVMVSDPGAKGLGGSGLAGDAVCDLRHHGGSDQAVYAFAREDLDRWEREIGRPLGNGAFGENLTTYGIDLTRARIGERWRIGGGVVLEITSGRIPCRTFQGWVGEKGWVRRFTRRAETGAYLRVLVPGEVRAGDPVEVIHRPAHEVTVQLAFRAVTLERELLPLVLAAGDALHGEELRLAREYVAKYGHGTAAPAPGDGGAAGAVPAPAGALRAAPASGAVLQQA
ncbi:MOSC domain-containing protein, partial [Streptomyces fuscigenes]|uniref:MOSC domain-containing protein n=1 Tax=Streptomyces fuscigenes TaxID=1528880 RepID=UPI001F248BDF